MALIENLQFMKHIRLLSPAFYVKHAALGLGVPYRIAHALGVALSMMRYDLADALSGEFVANVRGAVYGQEPWEQADVAPPSKKPVLLLHRRL